VTDVSLVSNKGVINADSISDHKMIYCEVNLSKNHCAPRVIKYRCYTNFNVSNFNYDLQNLPWNDIIYENDINNKIILFENLILRLFDIHAPVRESRITKPKAPWLTTNLKIFMRQRDAALSKFKKSKNLEDWNIYKNLRNFTLAQVRREKKKYIDSLCADKKNSRPLWNALRNLNLCRNKTNIIPAFPSDPDEINQFFNTFVQNNTVGQEQKSFYEQHLFNNTSSFSFRLTDVKEVSNILNNIKTNAAGADQITSSMLKYCSPFIDKYLTHIINCCIEA